MWTFEPITSALRSRVLHHPPRDLEREAVRTRELFPATVGKRPPAIALEGQLERVTGWVFADEAEQRACLAGMDVQHAPTLAHDLEGVVLLDGVLYKNGAQRPLHWRTRRIPVLHAEVEVEHASIYSTWNGHRWFGMWLADDCAVYPLAEQEGDPFTTSFVGTPAPHESQYEAKLGMRPRRESAAILHRVTVFDDHGHNADKHRRMREVRRRLLDGVTYEKHPGVFLVRGTTGDKRLCRNELEIAELVAKERGLRILDCVGKSVDEIVATCAGAELVMGVEGSQLIHGQVLLDAGASVFVLQPPDRFCSIFKDYADRDHQRFAYVVGRPAEDGFHVDPDEVLRTLALVPPVG